MRIKGSIEKKIEVHVLLGEIYHGISNLLDNLEELENKIAFWKEESGLSATRYNKSIERLKAALNYFVIEDAGMDEVRGGNKDE